MLFAAGRVTLVGSIGGRLLATPIRSSRTSSPNSFSRRASSRLRSGCGPRPCLAVVRRPPRPAMQDGERYRQRQPARHRAVVRQSVTVNTIG